MIKNPVKLNPESVYRYYQAPVLLSERTSSGSRSSLGNPRRLLVQIRSCKPGNRGSPAVEGQFFLYFYQSCFFLRKVITFKCLHEYCKHYTHWFIVLCLKLNCIVGGVLLI